MLPDITTPHNDNLWPRRIGYLIYKVVTPENQEKK